MLSRLAASKLKAAAVGFGGLRPVLVRCSTTAATSSNPNIPPGREVLVVKEGPERDLVNFPRLKRPMYPGKVRLGFIPEEWFQYFYPKTGVTGPYLFGTGLVTYLYSKEIMVMDHEFYVGLTIIMMTVFTMKKFGHTIAKYLDDENDADLARLNQGRVDAMDGLKEAIENEARSQWQAEGQTTLFEAKKENVALQLETEFRRRQYQVYSEVKRRLDYQLETVNIQRRLQQKHMVDWVVNNVLKSISPQQEKDMLAKCISDLKGLAKA